MCLNRKQQEQKKTTLAHTYCYTMDTETMASPDMLDLNASSPPHASQAPPVPEQQFDTPNGANNDFRASANGTEYKEYNSASKQSHHAWRKRV